MNKPWHLEHKMPPKATLEQRLQWHLEHTRHCACREAPPTLQKLIKEKLKAES